MAKKYKKKQSGTDKEPQKTVPIKSVRNNKIVPEVGGSTLSDTTKYAQHIVERLEDHMNKLSGDLESGHKKVLGSCKKLDTRLDAMGSDVENVIGSVNALSKSVNLCKDSMGSLNSNIENLGRKDNKTKNRNIDWGNPGLVIVLVLLIIGSHISILWCLDSVSLEGDSKKKQWELNFNESTHLTNKKFYYSDGAGHWTFNFYDPYANLTHFTVRVPEGIEMSSFEVSYKNGEKIDVDTRKPGGGGLIFQRKNNTNFTSGIEFEVSINFTGELQPTEKYEFSGRYNRSICADGYDITMKFKNWECLCPCVDVIRGEYDNFEIYSSNSHYLTIKSTEDYWNHNCSEAIEMTMYAKRATDDYIKISLTWIVSLLLSVPLTLWMKAKS